MRLVSVLNPIRSTVLGDRIEVAETTFTRLFGLLGRQHLSAGRGLWIKPSSGVHTFGMAFPIDVLGLDCEFHVLRLWADLVPFRLTLLSTNIRSMLELPAGTIAHSATQRGDRLRFSDCACIPPA